ELRVSFSGDCWTEVTDAGGDRLWFGLGSAGRNITVSGEAPLQVLLGNSANASLEVNGSQYAIPRSARRGATARLPITKLQTAKNLVKPKAIRGMNDVLPEISGTWRYVEEVVREVVEAFGYSEIRLPLLEYTELFRRSIGEVTDIVEKEMYTFDDRHGESLTLRPEATAGVVRAGITNGLLYNQRQKLWTAGPMFRYEKPQQGRYRQFHQIDVEALGYEGPDVDAELILMCRRFWSRLNIPRVTLEINSLGNPETRRTYRGELVHYFSAAKDSLDEDSLRRLEQNPLRILDSKNPAMQELVAGAPVMLDYLDEESARHFEELKAFLDAAALSYRVNPRLVRGLDYYNRTVFEWVTDALGSQGAVCSGGRYDGLVEKLGGRPVPAIGWAMGVERLVALYEVCGNKAPARHP